MNSVKLKSNRVSIDVLLTCLIELFKSTLDYINFFFFFPIDPLPRIVGRIGCVHFRKKNIARYCKHFLHGA